MIAFCCYFNFILFNDYIRTKSSKFLRFLDFFFVLLKIELNFLSLFLYWDNYSKSLVIITTYFLIK